jgi:hypothetical protein
MQSMINHWIEENRGKLTVAFSILSVTLFAHSVFAAGRQGVAATQAIWALGDRQNNAALNLMKNGLERASPEEWREFNDATLQYRREFPLEAAKLLEAGASIKADLDGEILKAVR